MRPMGKRPTDKEKSSPVAVLDFSPTVGDRIVLALRKANMTQVDLARELHVAQSTVSRWVRDQAPITVRDLQRIAQVTGQRRLVLDLVDLADDTSEQGERRSTWTVKGAGQRRLDRAA